MFLALSGWLMYGIFDDVACIGGGSGSICSIVQVLCSAVLVLM